MYTIHDFTNLMLFIINHDYEFIAMYKAAGNFADRYINEKYQIAKDNFGMWWLDLDVDLQEMFMNYAKKFYEEKDNNSF